jgi:hypothetical protein
MIMDGVGIAVVGDTLISLWKEPATVGRCRAVRAEMARMSAQSAEGFLWFNVILSTSSPPDRAARAEIAASLDEVRARLRKLVVVPLGDSLWHSVVRAIVRGMAVVTGMSKQQIVAATVAEGLLQMAKLATPRTPPTKDLEAALYTLCDGLGVDRALAA